MTFLSTAKKLIAGVSFSVNRTGGSFGGLTYGKLYNDKSQDEERGNGLVLLCRKWILLFEVVHTEQSIMCQC